MIVHRVDNEALRLFSLMILFRANVLSKENIGASVLAELMTDKFLMFSVCAGRAG